MTGAYHGDDAAHGHVAGHGHGDGGSRVLATVLGLTLGIAVVEVIGSAVSGSLSLLADAGHVLTDAGGLAVALTAAVLARRAPTTRRTWGFRRLEVVAAAAQAALLLAVGLFVLVAGGRRLLHPAAVEPGTMAVFGAIGLLGNLVGVAILYRSRSGTLNLRAAFLEVANDALGSAAVLVAAAVVALIGFGRADSLASLVIGALILPRTVILLRETLNVLLESTPPGVDLDEVRGHLLAVEHIRGVHDLHATTVATGLPTLTAHVVADPSCFTDGHLPRLLDELQRCLAEHFDVEHSTFQFEPVSHADHEHATHA